MLLLSVVVLFFLPFKKKRSKQYRAQRGIDSISAEHPSQRAYK